MLVSSLYHSNWIQDVSLRSGTTWWFKDIFASLISNFYHISILFGRIDHVEENKLAYLIIYLHHFIDLLCSSWKEIFCSVTRGSVFTPVIHSSSIPPFEGNVFYLSAVNFMIFAASFSGIHIFPVFRSFVQAIVEHTSIHCSHLFWLSFVADQWRLFYFFMQTMDLSYMKHNNNTQMHWKRDYKDI